MTAQPLLTHDVCALEPETDKREGEERGKVRILVIEDDIEAATYVVKGLRESGHIVDHAGDGEEGVTLALSGT